MREYKNVSDSSIKVSILCLTFNQKAYIRDALDSFVSQITDFSYEILVHDDASDDGTREIVQEYERRFPDKFRPVYQTENQYSKGVNIFEEILVPRARGTYLAVCEGDDYWTDRKKLQKQADFLDRHPDYSACTHSTKIINCINGRARIYHPARHSYTLKPEDVILWDRNCFQTSSLMYRKLYAYKPREMNAGEVGDYPLALWLLSQGRIYYMKEVMSVYRKMAAGSWSEKRNKMNQLEAKRSLVKAVNRMLCYYDDYTGRKYSKWIRAVKRRGKTDILSAQGRYREVVRNYRDVWMRYRKRSMVLLFIRAYFPKTARLAEWVKNNIL